MSRAKGIEVKSDTDLRQKLTPAWVEELTRRAESGLRGVRTITVAPATDRELLALLDLARQVHRCSPYLQDRETPREAFDRQHEGEMALLRVHERVVQELDDLRQRVEKALKAHGEHTGFSSPDEVLAGILSILRGSHD